MMHVFSLFFLLSLLCFPIIADARNGHITSEQWQVYLDSLSDRDRRQANIQRSPKSRAPNISDEHMATSLSRDHPCPNFGATLAATLLVVAGANVTMNDCN